MAVRDEIENRAYYARRAREEREKASISGDDSVALSHLAMAEEYERRATNPEHVGRPLA